MTRTIRLTRIHALNWYGYKDTIPVEGNLLLAGLTGSGKSILMDLIQFVLVGDQRLVRFNQSATGDRSDRSLKGYCLGDTKEEENGVTQYMRSSAITYVALEFTWPNGKKCETWGIRVEFTSAAEAHGKVTPVFYSRIARSRRFSRCRKAPAGLYRFQRTRGKPAGTNLPGRHRGIFARHGAAGSSQFRQQSAALAFAHRDVVHVSEKFQRIRPPIYSPRRQA